MVSTKSLRQVEIFSNLSEEELRQIAELCRERVLGEGEWCFQAGAPAQNLFILQQGRVALVFDLSRFWDGEGYITIETIEPGQIFGWSALVPPHELTLSARCLEPCTVYVLPRDGLFPLFERDREVGYRVMANLARVISKRLRVTQQKLVLEMGTAVEVDHRP